MIEDNWIILVVFLVMCLEIVFFWWLFACDGWVKLQKYGDNFWYKPRHKIKTRFERQMHYVEIMMAKSKHRRLRGYAVDGHVFCRCDVDPGIGDFTSKLFLERKDGRIKIWR